jgi:hypothetical protein
MEGRASVRNVMSSMLGSDVEECEEDSAVLSEVTAKRTYK